MGLVETIMNYTMREKELALQKEQWTIQKKQLDMAIEERDKHLQFLNSLPPEQQQIGMLSKDLLAKSLYYDNLIKKISGGEEQQKFTPESASNLPDAQYDVPTGKYLPTGTQTQPGLSGQMANQQLFGGMNPQDMIADILKKETGIGESVEPVKTEPMLNPQTNRMEIGQVLRNGQIRFTGQIVPPEITWKDAMGPQGVFQEAYDKQGNRIPQFDRTNIPQETQSIQGTMPGTNLPGLHVVPKNVPPGFQGLAVPQAVKGEQVTLTGPKGEQSSVWVNPYGAGQQGGAAKGGIPGMQTKPPQPTVVGTAQQTQMMKSGMEALKKIKNSIFDPNTGAINRKNLANAKLGMPRSEGKRIGDLIGSALNAIRLASTGAAFSPKELEELKRQYIPDYLANDQQVYDQWDQLSRFIEGMLQQMDPNEVFTKNQREEFNKLINIPRKTKKYEKMSDEELLKQLGK